MAENLDTARFSAIFISAIEMGHEIDLQNRRFPKSDPLYANLLGLAPLRLVVFLHLAWSPIF